MGAIAVQNGKEILATSTKPRLAISGLFGALFVMGGIALTAYVVPDVWRSSISPVTAKLGSFVDVALRLTAQLAVFVGTVWMGVRLPGANRPGIRAATFFCFAGILSIFLVVRYIGTSFEGSDIGLPIAAVFAALLLGFGFRGLSSERGESWIHTVEDQGWFHATSYKKTQGHKGRRYTLIGMLAICWSGVWSLFTHQNLGTGAWTMTIPFSGTPKVVVTILSDIEYSVPVILAVLSFWICWRIVNIPTFSDFLIATEAEMNKVSWSTRRRLIQDTIVVLVATILLTAFLLVVDLFWGWLLSREAIKILPSRSQEAAKIDPLQGKKVDW